MAASPALWDASRMADLEALVRLLTRGAEAARGEARRILDELVGRGDLSRAEADEIDARVREAVDANRRWLDERVVSPLRDALRGAGGALRRALDDDPRPGPRDDALLARLAALEARLARVEARLAGRGAPADG
jgi:polyhydroxyalkanoate synthesis regulator phasin